MARRISQLANEAMQLAQRDIDDDRHRSGYDDWGMGGRGGGMGGGGILGPAVGGLLLGGLIGDMFD